MTLNDYKAFLVLFILAISSWFLADLFEEKEFREIKVVENSPDFFSLGYYKKEMTASGLVKNELNAKKMTHYSGDGTTHLENPRMTLYNSDVPPWIIESDSGILEADGDNLLLTGKVNIKRERAKKVKPFNINTSDLRVKLSISYAETDKWAEIIEVPHRTEGVGMEVTFTAPIHLKFLSRVKGRYVFN